MYGVPKAIPEVSWEFGNQLTAGYGSYAEKRAQLSRGMTVDDFVSEIKRGKALADSRQSGVMLRCVKGQRLWDYSPGTCTRIPSILEKCFRSKV